MDRLVLLGKIPLFAGISTEQLLAVSEIAEDVEFSSGEEVFRKGSMGQHLYVLVKGEVKVLSGDLHLATLKAGECFGELALLDHSTRTATIRALGPITCLKLARTDFEDLLDVSPDLSRAVMHVLSQRLRDCLRSEN
jgi:CRP-like cAMP-binding protein